MGFSAPVTLYDRSTPSPRIAPNKFVTQIGQISLPLSIMPVTRTKTPWTIGGSRGLCRSLVNRDFNNAKKYVLISAIRPVHRNLCRLLKISPSLINNPHPLGWAPLHTAILTGDPTLVTFVLDLPGVDLTIKDRSTFNATTTVADIICRQNELCANICGTESTSGATALHFACMRGEWEILNLLLEAGASYNAKDDSKRLPQEYFDLERVDLETYETYHAALKVRHTRWRSLAKKSKDKLFVLYAIFKYYLQT